MAKNVEITAVYLGEKHRFPNSDGDVVIAEARHIDGPKPDGVNGRLSLKGPADEDDLKYQLSYRFYGYWTEYKNRRLGTTEPQFAFSAFVESQPHGRAGVVAYLTKAGEGLGIGKARAAKLFDEFQQDAVRICREEPERAFAAVPGWSLAEAKALSEMLAKQVETEHCSIELIEILNKRGFPKSTPKKAIDLWGSCAAEIIRRNPYVLMQFRGCGFARTDKMYLDLGHKSGRPKRQALCAWHTIASDSDGHTWHPVERAIKGIEASISPADRNVAKALQLTKRHGILSYQRTDGDRLVNESGRLWVAETTKANSERRVAERISQAIGPNYWPNVADLSGPTPHQIERLAKSLTGLIGIFGGSPGTGKTYCAASLILALIREHGCREVAVCAPTGKAAVRISEAMNAYGVNIRATTIHSMLGVENSGDSNGGWSFQHNFTNPLPYRFIIVDESSMIDVPLMAALLDARAAGTHILFVGDVNQLPPVGHGAPLRDMIAAELPYGELTEIKRQDGSVPNMIIQACAAIRQGQTYETLRSVDEVDIAAGRNLVRIESYAADDQKVMLRAALEWSRLHGFDPVWAAQPLAAVNKKSQLSRKDLNELLQHELNSSEGINGQIFRVRDKIVNTKNGWFPPEKSQRIETDEQIERNSNGEVYVANGELAEILEVEEKFLIAKLTSPARTIRIPKGKAKDVEANPDTDTEAETSTGCSWDLGYCLSTHKSQGSEWPISIVMLDDYAGARMVCSREWLYTAISRGKQLVIEIGKESTAKRMIDKVAIWDRKTLLKERICQEQIKRAVEEM